jgi:protease-4
MSDMAGSGGYWVAMGANKIIAQPQTLTGSIGVLSGKFDISGLAEKLGITSEKIALGKRADLFSPFRPLSPEERALFRKQILWIYERFLAQAAEGRNMTPEAVDRVGKGRVWTGRQAKELGLVDECGGLPKAIETAKGLAGLSREEEVRLVVWPKRTSFFRSLLGRGPAETKNGLSEILPRSLRAALDWALRLNTERVWAVMPFLPE